MKGGEFPTAARGRLADHAYNVLLHKIVTGEFREGDPLPSEKELCALFEISRPVVREALQRLREQGVITSRRGAGSFVQKALPEEVSSTQVVRKRQEMLENLEFRHAIEPQAAALAAERRLDSDLAAIQEAIDRYARAALEGSPAAHLDFRFHLAVATASHNRRFVDAICSVEQDISHGVNLSRFLSHFAHLERSRSVLADHTRILVAIRQKRPEEARRAMRAHLENARLRMIDAQPALADSA
ncbi:FadR family transcriptional regulator [Roseomonas sp. OT10]|uniref:FadR/GntR family transcriptional regulator n=1 Tax=Roseomonas cutis TaxID=2897332 RepID=UPI001E3CD5E5|nr:FadR/GntR family transcriptional regulator [Roseomonas sp. OT10]UFN48456.1 FadR family transcriptional regulator [Roseomonas sp. OT10]